MFARSAHFVFPKKTRFKHMVKAYPEVLKTFLNETRQMPEEKEFMEMLIRSDVQDLEMDRKPEGYNRQGKMRLVFPIKNDDKIEFYIYKYVKSDETAKVAEMLTKILNRYRLSHKVEWDRMVLFEQKERKKKVP